MIPYLNTVVLDHATMLWGYEFWKGPDITGDPDPLCLEAVSPVYGDHKTLFKVQQSDVTDGFALYMPTVTFQNAPFYKCLPKHGYYKVAWWNRPMSSWHAIEELPFEVEGLDI